MEFSVVIPARNEEENIEHTLNELENKLSVPHEVVVVNDHSTDRTVGIVAKIQLRNKNIRLISNNFSPGFANALKTGFQSVQTNRVVPVMADLCDKPEDIPLMLEKINQGFDIVCGSRYMRKGKKIKGPKFQSFFSKFVGLSLWQIIKVPTHDIANSFKLYKKEVIENVDIKSRGFEISMEIALKAHFKGYRLAEIPTVWRGRTMGKSKFYLLKVAPNYIRLYLWAICKSLTKKGSRERKG